MEELESDSLEFLFDRDIDPTTFEVKINRPSQFFKEGMLYVKVSSRGQFVQHYLSQSISTFHEGQTITLKGLYEDESLLSLGRLPSTVTVHLLTRDGKKKKQGIFPFWGNTKSDRDQEDSSVTDNENIIRYLKDANIRGLADFNFESLDADGKIIFRVVPEINTERLGEPEIYLFTQYVLSELCTYFLLKIQEMGVYHYEEIMENSPQSSCLYTIAHYLSQSRFPEFEGEKVEDDRILVKDALEWKNAILVHYWKLNSEKLGEWRTKVRKD